MTHRDLDDEPWPIPVHWEKPGPPPRRRITFGRPMVIVVALAVVALLALSILVLVPNPFGVSPG